MLWFGNTENIRGDTSRLAIDLWITGVADTVETFTVLQLLPAC